MRIPASVILGLLAGMSNVSVATSADHNPLPLGYVPTANKHIAKRAKRKAAKQKARSCKPSEKQHKDRNKKGRP